MAIKDVFKFSRKTFFNPSEWLSLNILGAQTQLVVAAFKAVFVRKELSHQQETFEEALIRLQVSEAELPKIAQRYFILALVFLGCALFSFCFSFYILLSGKTITGWLLGLSVSSLAFAQAFRYHFWYFEIKHRKLGCTFKEWWQGKVTTNPAAKDELS